MMYNRYIPQPDGSHHRRSVQEPKHPQPQRPQKPAPCPVPNPPTNKEPCPEQSFIPQRKPQETSMSNFLRQLLPKDFDTGDLIVVLLLLLMAGDCAEDRNHAILTLALYFLM